jgi:hypothetical protein
MWIFAWIFEKILMWLIINAYRLPPEYRRRE